MTLVSISFAGCILLPLSLPRGSYKRYPLKHEAGVGCYVWLSREKPFPKPARKETALPQLYRGIPLMASSFPMCVPCVSCHGTEVSDEPICLLHTHHLNTSEVCFWKEQWEVPSLTDCQWPLPSARLPAPYKEPQKGDQPLPQHSVFSVTQSQGSPYLPSVCRVLLQACWHLYTILNITEALLGERKCGMNDTDLQAAKGRRLCQVWL